MSEQVPKPVPGNTPTPAVPYSLRARVGYPYSSLKVFATRAKFFITWSKFSSRGQSFHHVAKVFITCQSFSSRVKVFHHVSKFFITCQSFHHLWEKNLPREQSFHQKRIPFILSSLSRHRVHCIFPSRHQGCALYKNYQWYIIHHLVEGDIDHHMHMTFISLRTLGPTIDTW